MWFLLPTYPIVFNPTLNIKMVFGEKIPKIDTFSDFVTIFFIKCYKAKKRKCLVSGYPTDPNILGPTQTFLKTFGILKSIFRLFLRIFILFQCKKVFIKKKVCLPTVPKNFGHVTGNKTYFSFWPNKI